jgi:hypothetical protein
VEDPGHPLVVPDPTDHASELMGSPPLGASFVRLLVLFGAAQGVSFLLLAATLGQFSRSRVWLYGLAGPFVAVEGVTKFPYHPWWQNGLYLVLATVILVAPLALLRIPGRRGVAISAGGVVAWILFGLAQSIHHI